MTAFNITDPETWPVVLTAEEVAAILRRKVGGLKREAARMTLVPAPFERHPYKWRRADIERHVIGARGTALRRVVSV